MRTSPYDPQDMFLKVKGENLAPALNSSSKIAALLTDLEAPGSGANLKARINVLLNNPTAKLAGLGGVPGRTALGAAMATLDGPGLFEGALDSVEVVGEIQKTDPSDPTLPGFYFNAGDPMYMWVKMTTTATRNVGNGLKLEFQSAEMYRVQIAAGDVMVEPRSSGSDAFPLWTNAAGFQVDPKDFQYKLWGVGNGVRVTEYWEDKDCQPQCGSTWQKWTAANAPARLQNIFAPDPDACIDMMFKENPADFANNTLPPDAEPPFYCLGRCKNPPILNTR